MIWFIPIRDSSITRPLSEKERKELSDYKYRKYQENYLAQGKLKNAYISDWVREMQEYMYSKNGRDLTNIKNHFFLQPKWKQWYIRKIVNFRLVKKYGWKQVFTNNV